MSDTTVMAFSNPPGLANFSETRRAILDFLKRQGPVRAEDVATHIGITPSGIRQHLTGLERDGLILYQEHREGPGRPKHIYCLTSQGDALFPRRYDELTNELLSYVESEDPELLPRLFERRARRRLEHARTRLAELSFPEKVRELANILDADGYLAEFREIDDGSFLLTEHNCAVLGVAKRYGLACISEIGFLRASLPEASIERVAHMLSGAHVCAYAIRLRVE